MPVRRYYPLPPPNPEEEARKRDMCCDGCMMLPTAVKSLMIFGLSFYILAFMFSFHGRAQNLFPGENYYLALLVFAPIHVALYVLTLHAVANNAKGYLVPNIMLQSVLAFVTIVFAIFLAFKHKPDSNLVALGHAESVQQALTIALCLIYFVMKMWNMIVLIKYYDYLTRRDKQLAYE